jgi:hypothetical protein
MIAARSTAATADIVLIGRTGAPASVRSLRECADPSCR